MEVIILVLFYGFIICMIPVIRNMKKSQDKGSSTPNRQDPRKIAETIARSTGKTGKFFSRALADDGHYIEGKDDISCRQYGHNQPDADVPRFIPHDDPEDGYIILNGKKMLRTEADRYENSI